MNDKLKLEENKKFEELITSLNNDNNIFNLEFYKIILNKENFNENFIFKLIKYLVKCIKKNNYNFSELLIVINILNKLILSNFENLSIFKTFFIDLINNFSKNKKDLVILKILKDFNKNGLLNNIFDKFLNIEDMNYDRKRKFFKLKLKSIKEENLINFCLDYLKKKFYVIDIYIYLSKNINIIKNENFQIFLLNFLLKNYRIDYVEELFSFCYFLYKFIKFKKINNNDLFLKVYIFVNNLSKINIIRIQKYSLKCLKYYDFNRIPVDYIFTTLIPESFEDYKNIIEIENLNCIIKIKGSIFYSLEDENPDIRIKSFKVLDMIYHRVDDITLKKNIIKMLILNLNDDYDYVRWFILNILIKILNNFSIKQKFFNLIKNFTQDTNILIRLTIYILLRKLKIIYKNFIEIKEILKNNFINYENERCFIYELLNIWISKLDIIDINNYISYLNNKNDLYNENKDIDFNFIVKILFINYSLKYKAFNFKIPEYYNKIFLIITNLYYKDYDMNNNEINSKVMTIYFNEIAKSKKTIEFNINNTFFYNLFSLLQNFIKFENNYLNNYKSIKMIIYLQDIIQFKSNNFVQIINNFKKYFLLNYLLRFFKSFYEGKNKSIIIVKLIEILQINLIPEKFKNNLINLLSDKEMKVFVNNYLEIEISKFKNQSIELQEDDLKSKEMFIRIVNKNRNLEYNPNFPLNINFFIFSNFEIDKNVKLNYSINNILDEEIEVKNFTKFLIKKEEYNYYELEFDINLKKGFNIEAMMDIKFTYSPENELCCLFKDKCYFTISETLNFKIISNY